MVVPPSVVLGEIGKKIFKFSKYLIFIYFIYFKR
jgi:hypothetical protein